MASRSTAGSSSDPDCSVALAPSSPAKSPLILANVDPWGPSPRGGSNLLLSPHRNTPPSCNAHISSSFQASYTSHTPPAYGHLCQQALSPPCEPPILPNRQVLFVGTEIRDIDIPISGVAMNAYSLLPSRPFRSAPTSLRPPLSAAGVR
eukprot:g44948.t1